MMMRIELPFRQIHLDFHTSAAIEGIGADFDPDVFADTLQRAHVNSINLFARGHHGWVYYDTARFPERRHPHLKRDLLREQIDACHARGIRTPVYVTVQWDHYTALQHPEWRVMQADGCLEGTPPYEAGFYRRLCLNTPYVEWLKRFVQELMETLPIDGLWLDIVDAQDCSCWYCREGMLAQGLEPSNQAHRVAYGKQVLHTFQREMTALIHDHDPKLLVFYNSGHVGPRHRRMIDWFTHFELESLPSGGWGYLHFPIAARYARSLGRPFLGMTGKFQTSWGDFHSYKNPAALEFECLHMLALNAQCSIGDQLHPRGAIDQPTYDLIGGVYAQVEEKEPWCAGAQQVVDIGVLTPEEFDPALRRADVDFRPMMGATRMLQEGAHQFDIIDSSADLDRYKVVVLPDEIPVSEALADKLTRYLAEGGALLASFASGMDQARTRFTLDALGVCLTGEGPRDAEGRLVRGREYPGNAYVQYLIPREQLAKGLPRTEHVMYMRGMEVEATAKGEVLADTISSYFDRTYAHFCSHRQTPSSGQVAQPGVVQSGRSIYFSHPIFAQYQTKVPRWCRQLFLNALDRLLPEPLVRIEGPTGTLATLNQQREEGRWVLHLLFYVPERRCEGFDVVEDIVPLYDVPVSVRVDRAVRDVQCVPAGQHLAFGVEAGRVRFTVPVVRGHQMVALSFA
jgi:hypothetical protein